MISVRFQSLCFEENLNFFLIGVLCGLAIYNFTIINVPFPLVLYKKLLNEVGGSGLGPDDLEGLSPVVAKGLILLTFRASSCLKQLSLRIATRPLLVSIINIQRGNSCIRKMAA